MNWGIEDFAAAAALLIGAAVALVLVFRVTRDRLRRILFSGVVIVIVLAMWAHLALGIRGRPSSERLTMGRSAPGLR